MTKKITNLQELRAAKAELKRKMAREDAEAKEGFLYSTLNKLFNRVEQSSSIHRTPVGSGVNTALNFISNQAGSRFNLGNSGKSLLSVAVVVLAPLIAKKVQEFIDEKF